MRGHDSVIEFKCELACLRTKLLHCRRQAYGQQDLASIQVGEHILTCLQYYERPQSDLFLYQLQIHTCIEQIDDNLIWARSQLLYIIDFDSSLNSPNIYRNDCNEQLIQCNRKALLNLSETIV
ncbi:hypothetical protein QNI19_11080 [Cytophagaceae bacterium DM2B3-1]|uniref:Uncharacterized protein n=1 Tax=Xanthocytophaga flava TaxID=3048013 RepID=A0ABT7CIX5_9BACT|nr:hypothetical protein [Xanthocytophaga flavus]MDJ1493476.1 hypothetical protein [Xanthocytophaga flavus]